MRPDKLWVVGLGRRQPCRALTLNMFDHYLTPSQDEIVRYWQLADAQMRHSPAQPFKASPAATAPVIRLAESGALQLVAARWGLIPMWWKEQKPPADAFVAPSEEATARPIWKIPASKSRCLVPATAWYEWQKVERRNPATGELMMMDQPCLIRLPDRQTFAFAGLMSRRSVDGIQPEFSFTILTREASGPSAQICARVPIVLPRNAHAAWLYRELTDAAIAVDFAREQALTEFVHHAIDLRNENDRDGNATLISGGLDIHAGNAPFVLAYGRPHEAARAVNVVNAVSAVNIVSAANAGKRL